jgi:hypothetical protein
MAEFNANYVPFIRAITRHIAEVRTQDQLLKKFFPCLTKHYSMKTYGGVNVQIHVFLTSALVGVKCWASRPCRYIPGEIAPGMIRSVTFSIRKSVFLLTELMSFSSGAPRNRVILENPTVVQVLNNLPAICCAWRSISVFTRAHHCSAFWATLIQPKSTYCKHQRSILILSRKYNCRYWMINLNAKLGIFVKKIRSVN